MKRKMKSRIQLHWWLLALVFCHVSKGFGQTTTVGLSFGSPSLVDLRATYQYKDSPWTWQGEFSSLILERNRSNGKINLVSAEAQWGLANWESVHTFAFVSVSYLWGYLDKRYSSMTLWSPGMGGGVWLEISERLALVGEGGVMLPMETVKGFDFVGVIANLGIRWTL